MKNLDTVIEDYLTGKLSPEELSHFEKLISENQNLQEELTIQKDIVDSIKQARKNDLKVKLAAMKPNAGLSIPQKLIIASATLIGASLLTLGIYSSVSTEELTESTPSTNTTLIETDTETPQKGIILDKKTNENTTNVIAKIIEPKNTKSESIDIAKEITATVAKDKVEAQAQNKVEAINLDDLLQDDISDELDELHNVDTTAPENLNSGTISSTNQISFGVITDCNEDVNGYTYSRGSLLLCGDFKESEFTIYKDGGSGKFYFSYKNDYYKIVESNSFEKFEDNLITNLKIIERLPK